MRNKKYLKTAVINEYLLIKSTGTVFWLVLIATDIIFPSLFILLNKHEPAMFRITATTLSQYFFPLFCAILTVFVLRNYVEHYRCEIYFLYSKLKFRETLLTLLLYAAELTVPTVVCVCIDRNMAFEFMRIFCQCVFFSALSYMLVFITMSTSLSLSAIFIYTLLSICSESDILQKIIFFSLKEVNEKNIIKAVFPILIAAAAFYTVGAAANYIRSRRYKII